MTNSLFSPEQRLTRRQRQADDHRWFKDQLDTIDSLAFSRGVFGFDDEPGAITEYTKMKINYDLYNNKINKSDFEKVCYPFGRELGELPVDFTNKDIVSGKVKALIGMEMKRPFAWRIVAVNKEATTRKEQEETDMLREFVVNSIMQPIQEQIEMEMQEELQGQELTPEEEEQVQQQVQERLKTMTPPEIKKYMQRDHQDPAEMMATQILFYLIQKQDIPSKFNSVWKHGLISGKEIMWAGIVAGEPVLKVVNPLRFDHDRASDADFIEDTEWACQEIFMSPSNVVKYFGGDLSDVEIDEIYEDYANVETLPDSAFSFRQDSPTTFGVRVIHAEWKALKLIKFVTGVDIETGEPYEAMVDETYKLDPEAGDIAIAKEWIITKFEGYKIGKDKYALLREVPGQHRDLDNLYDCKLSYIGAIYDDMNSEPTSLMDRMKFYQYLYNVLWYKIENLIATDEGKQLLINSNIIPKKDGLDFEKWMYYLKIRKVGFMDPSEEGNKGNSNMGEAAKEIDMSLISDITRYMQVLEHVENRCGESVGITKQIEGQIQEREGVRNVQQALMQSANILEPYFEIHNLVKRNALTALLNVAKVAYAEFQPQYLSYVLDDMSLQMLMLDPELLDESTYGLFIANSSKAFEALQNIQQLSQAAMQNQRIELSHAVMISNAESTQEAEEMLKAAEEERIEREQEAQEREQQAAKELQESQQDFQERLLDKNHEHKMDEIRLKGDYDLQKQTILSIGFNEDKDLDKDGVPDVLEVYKAGIDADIKMRKQDLEEKKFEDGKKVHKDRMEREDKKIKLQMAKKQIKS